MRVTDKNTTGRGESASGAGGAANTSCAADTVRSANAPRAAYERGCIRLNAEERRELDSFLRGESVHAYRVLGAHRRGRGFVFRVYAPSASAVALVGDFNSWQGQGMVFDPRYGIWSLYCQKACMGHRYKYAVTAPNGAVTLKTDPFAVRCEMRPGDASVLWELPDYAWHDSLYDRAHGLDADRPINIYEAHLGSWELGLGFTSASTRLIEYCRDMGYTHIELMPLSEHPLDESWGYQTGAYYAVTSRYGTPEEFKLFIDRAHMAGLGVILDWVPAHFVKNDFGLRLFDGTPLFEPAEPLRAEMPLWGTLLFDYNKPCVRSFLISNAVWLLNEFCVDGLRVDAVSCMLYHDFCRERWLPEPDGSNINRAAVAFLRQCNAAVHTHTLGRMIAEESSAFPHVTGDEGLGFDYKWNMGFMNDTLSYFEKASVYRKYHHDKLTFPMTYAYAERHILPLSHDEVVHGKRSLIGRMEGNYDAKFAQLRLLFAYQYACPGKKLNFMGGEFGQFIEWDHKRSLDWFLLAYPAHAAMQDHTRALNSFYKSNPALWRDDIDWEGYRWLNVNDSEHSIIAFRRRDPVTGQGLICIFNFTPGEYEAYPVDVSSIMDELGQAEAIPKKPRGRGKKAPKVKLGCVFSTAGRQGAAAELCGTTLSVPLYGYEGAMYEIR